MMLINFRHRLSLAVGIPSLARLKASKGFTLIELMIVISILVILLAGTAPAYMQWNSNRQLFRHANDLFSDMQSAKLEAVRNNCNIVLSFDLANDRYQVFRDDGGTAGVGAQNDVQDGDEFIISTVTMPPDISIIIDGADFGATTTPGFTSRALPILGRTGNVVFQRNGETHRWYRAVVRPAGLINLQVSTDSTDGTDGTWGDV